MSLPLVQGNGEMARSRSGTASVSRPFSSVEETKVDKRVAGLRLVHRSKRFGGLERAPE
jgi:hypothetical protein